MTEYGAHLRSHTSILKSMSDASSGLAAVVAELHRTPEATQETPPREVHPARPKDPAAPTPEPRWLDALLDYLRSSSYSEWSLLIPEVAARVVGTTSEAVVRTLATLPDVELIYATVGDETIYRYRLTGER